MKICFQALDTGIANVDTIDKRKEPDEKERGQEMKVAFLGELASSFFIRRGGRQLDCRYGDLFVLEDGRYLTHV